MPSKQNPWDAILFDVDGTLIDSIPFIVESFQHTFNRHLGHSLDESAILSGIGRPLEAYLGAWPPELAKALLKTYLEYNHSHVREGIAIFLGIPAMLQSLRRLGLPMGIVTSKRLAGLLPTLDDFMLQDYFDLVITKDDTRLHKPDPEPLYEAMRRLGLHRPDRVLYVGDSIHDLECAVRAGCQPVMVEWTRMPKQSLKQAHPAIWLEHPSDLVQIVEA
jgi:pyrophosphatase PpaX